MGRQVGQVPVHWTVQGRLANLGLTFATRMVLPCNSESAHGGLRIWCGFHRGPIPPVFVLGRLKAYPAAVGGEMQHKGPRDSSLHQALGCAQGDREKHVIGARKGWAVRQHFLWVSAWTGRLQGLALGTVEGVAQVLEPVAQRLSGGLLHLHEVQLRGVLRVQA